ncbi:hypothetical protein C8J56DRAFT_1105695 [Mycena floridula]|nr:hypothetical protein C8J56DRAFT_1105695 [Mycena floridula]
MISSQKLTKKQKKGLAFRARKTKGKDGQVARWTTSTSADLEDNDVPVMEVQDIADEEDNTAQVEILDKKNSKAQGKGKGKAKATAVEAGPAVAAATSEKKSKKRKREEEEEGVEAKPEKKAKKAKQRYILFLGNLKYTTTVAAITAHFSKCDPPPSVRLLTPKVTSSKPNNKSKGCAFLEFSHPNALQQGLKLHQSQLDGRMVNVELTAGGGGKGQARTVKITQRNKGLFGQRTERSQKEAEKEGLGAVPTSQRPQRFSATSGVEQPPLSRRTWTVGEVEDGETHRGGQKHKQRGKRPTAKSWGTGMNAIPLN